MSLETKANKESQFIYYVKAVKQFGNDLTACKTMFEVYTIFCMTEELQKTWFMLNVAAILIKPYCSKNLLSSFTFLSLCVCQFTKINDMFRLYCKRA